MRWIPFLIFSYLVLILQCSVGKILVFHSAWPGPFGPDFLIIFALFTFLCAREPLDGILAGCILGLLWDLGMAGAGWRAGPMALTFAFCGWWIIGIREAVFRSRALTQMLLAALFVVVAHAVWITAQSFLALGTVSWGDYGSLLVRALLSAICTALLTPLLIVSLAPFRKWLVSPVYAAGRGRRDRRR